MTTTAQIATDRQRADRKLITTLLTEYRRTYGTPESGRTLARIAHKLATELGHLPLRQGESVECFRCAATGSAREVLSGSVHLTRCGSVPLPATYCTTYCNRGHRMRDGKPVGHECAIIPPSALEAEMDGRYEDAIVIMSSRHMPTHRGVKS